MQKDSQKNLIDDEIIFYEEEPEDIEDIINDEFDESSVNIAFSGSPLKPHIFTGDSAKPLQGQFHESEYKDDNIHDTWLGIMSFYG